MRGANRLSGLLIIMMIVCAFMFIESGCEKKPEERTDESHTETVVHELLVEPDDGYAPVGEAIDGARKTVDLVTYEIGWEGETENWIINSLIGAKDRGVEVRVMVNSESDTWTGANPSIAAVDRLGQEGIQTRWSWDEFDITHDKSLIIDGEKAFVMTGNFQDSYFSTTRDFLIITTEPEEVNQIQEVYDNDWEERSSTSLITSPRTEVRELVWSPENAREKIMGLLNGAQKALKVYAAFFEDMDCVDAMCEAVQDRDVSVRVMASIVAEECLEKLDAAGVQVRTGEVQGDLFNHAKMILADFGTDDNVAYVGSQNFFPASLDEYRELGILVDESEILKRLDSTFDEDWDSLQPVPE